MWTDRLEILRNIDSVIDFSRATAQLRILIALDNAALTIDEIVKETRLRRKTVLDAIRKLEIKGLVKREGGKFMLSKNGKAIYDALRSIVAGDEAPRSELDVIRGLSVKPSIYDTYTDLLSVIYMLKALKVLGSVSNHRLPLDKLASKVGVTPITLDNHLQRFVTRKMKLFNRLEVGPGGKIVYELNDAGLKLYQRLYPSKGLTARIREFLRKITGK